MSCCGNQRALLRRFAAAPNNQGYALAASVAVRGAVAADEPRVRYSGDEAIVLRGPRSGRVYAFEGGGTQCVHPDDLAILLRTGRFNVCADSARS